METGEFIVTVEASSQAVSKKLLKLDDFVPLYEDLFEKLSEKRYPHG